MLGYTEFASSPAPSLFFPVTAIEQEKQAGES